MSATMQTLAQSVAWDDRALQVQNLRVLRAGREIIHDLSMDVPAGQVTALLGPNGAGKSTLVLALGGIIKPAAGHIRAGGRELAGRRPEQVRTAGVAIVPEGRMLLPSLTVRDNLQVATYAMGREQGRMGIEHALDLFPELKARWDAPARALSGGQQQMVVLAQALVTKPDVLVVDELSLGLAPVVVKRLVPTLATVAASGVGVLLIEQFAHVALSLAETVHVLEGGRIRHTASAQAFRDDPNLLSAAYLLRGQDDDRK
jgi:branched-chain amino acid transport system ATP-binding protein